MTSVQTPKEVSIRTSSQPAVLFLAYESPWPATGGATLRTWGLLSELAREFDVELVVLSRKPLTAEQLATLQTRARQVTRVPMHPPSVAGLSKIALRMLIQRQPYHCAIIAESFQQQPDALRRIQDFPGVVYANFSHWAALIDREHAPNWILDQQNADIEFWRIYALEAARHPLKRLAAQLNWHLADHFFRRAYRRVGRIVSVCEDDQRLTLDVAPSAQVDVIENGIDCRHYVPNRRKTTGAPRMLFTGTSVLRNMRALHYFAQEILPRIHQDLPDAELLVGGAFSEQAQAELGHYRNIRFTGRVPDMRPVFDQSDVYVAPFQDAYGSKLKIAEAMAMAMPIVATPSGIRGFPLIDSESVLVAHSNEQFARHVVTLLRDSAYRARLGDAARHVALASIDWQLLGRRLATIVQETLPETPALCVE